MRRRRGQGYKSSGGSQEERDHDERECQGWSCRRGRSGGYEGSTGRSSEGKRRSDGQYQRTRSWQDKRRAERRVNAGKRWSSGR